MSSWTDPDDARSDLYLRSSIWGSCADEASVTILVKIHAAGIDVIRQDSNGQVSVVSRFGLFTKLFHDPNVLVIGKT